MAYIPIPYNPYIVGNPIQSEKMFYGRNEDFLYIRDKLQQETRGLIITLAGERRSGKTSILFQIMNGRLGEEYLPFFVDMQAMAAVESDNQFLARLDQCMRPQLDATLPTYSYQTSGWKDFESLLDEIALRYPGKKPVFLLDEYELIENKIEKNLLTEDLIIFIASLMENRDVYFIFTGSNKLEERQTPYWKTLFSKSQYRKITFLKRNDCLDLITRPLEGYVNYTQEQQEKIWRLTAGQPFYTQIFCQNMVDRLQLEQRNDVLEEDVDAVIADIVDNPMPQMIYFWQELGDHHKLALSMLAEVLPQKEDWADSRALVDALKAHNLQLAVTEKDIHTALEDLYHRDILSKRGSDYQFRVDIFRFWIKQEQNVWKLLKEIKLEKPESSARPWKFTAAAVILVLLIAAGAAWWLLKPKQEFGGTKNKQAQHLYKQANSYYEDSNYTLALKTVDSALKADSTYFKASLLRAEILNRMDRPEQALQAYQKAEGIYYRLTQDVGRLITSLPDSLAQDNDPRNWRVMEDFYVYDYLMGINMFIQLMEPPQNIHPALAAYNRKSGKWVFLPASSALAAHKHILYYYNAQGNYVAAHDSKTNRTLWQCKLPDTAAKYRYFALASLAGKWKRRHLVVFNRKGMYAVDARSGKLLGKQAFTESEVKLVHLDERHRKALVMTDRESCLYNLPQLKRTFRRETPQNQTLVSSHITSNLLYFIDVATQKSSVLKFIPVRDSLEIISIPLGPSVYALHHQAFFSVRADSLFCYDHRQDAARHIVLPENQPAKEVQSNFMQGTKPSYIHVLSDSSLFVLDSRGKSIQQIPFAALNLGEGPVKPEKVEYDARRKRLIFTAAPDQDPRSDNRILGIYDIRKDELLFSMNLSKSYPFILSRKGIYCLLDIGQGYDGVKVTLNYNALFIDPDSFQTMPYENMGLFALQEPEAVVVKGRNIFAISGYPVTEERSLQRIHEAMVLINDKLGKQDEVLANFESMLPYLRNLNNLPVSQAVLRSVIATAPDDLGFYASKLLDVDANFKALLPDLETAMNIRPNTAMPDLKLQEREYVYSVNDLACIRQFDKNYDNVSYYRLREGRREFLFTATRRPANVFCASDIYPFLAPGGKSQLHLWDQNDQIFSHPLPFNPSQRAVINWLNDDTLYYVTSRQTGQGFAYALHFMDKDSGKTELKKSWNSDKHLKGVITRNGQAGVVLYDSLKAVYYLPTFGSEALLPAFTRILSCNGSPLASAAELDPSRAESFELLYKTDAGVSGSISLSPLQVYQSSFVELFPSQLQWFDPVSAQFSAPLEFAKYTLKFALLEADNIDWLRDDPAAYDYFSRYYLDHLWLGGPNYALALYDLQTGEATWCQAPPSSPQLTAGYDYAFRNSALIYYVGMKNQNQALLSCYSFAPGGTLTPRWEVPFPWQEAELFRATPSHIISWAAREVQSGGYSRALIYLDGNTGNIDRRIAAFEDTTVLGFKTRPVLLWHPKLGFYDPVLPETVRY